jgi:lipopolysaccharide transport system permease protein
LPDLRALWSHRELLYLLALREIQSRYRQTALGVGWAILQPLTAMILFTIFFGRLSGLEESTSGAAYAPFVLAGLVPWTFFSSAVTGSAGSVVANAAIVTKVAFPRILIPLAALGAPFTDLLVSFVLLGAVLFLYQVPPSEYVLIIPLLLGAVVFLAAGLGCFFAAITVTYRDFRHVVPFVVQTLFYITPVIYPPSIVPEAWRWIHVINPMAGVVAGFRAGFLGLPVPSGQIVLSAATSTLLFIAGAAYFRRVERQFADVI